MHTSQHETVRLPLSVLGRQLKRQKGRIREYIASRFPERAAAADRSLHFLTADNKFLSVLCRKERSGYLPVIFTELKDCTDTEDIINKLKIACRTEKLSLCDIEFLPLLYSIGLVGELYNYAKKLDDEGFSKTLDRVIYPIKPDMARIISECCRLDKTLSESKDYLSLTADSRRDYRIKLAMVANAANVDELRLAAGYLTEEAKGGVIGRLIDEDFYRVFPPPSVKKYLIGIILPAVLAAALTALLAWNLFALLLIPPFYMLCKNIGDRLLLRVYRSRAFDPAKKENGGRIPDGSKTLCVISTLLTSPKDIDDAKRRAEEFLNKNRTDNLQVCLLCDLPQAKEMTSPSDKDILKELSGYAAAPIDNISFALRRRTYSAGQGCYMGYERKRGAIEQLAHLLICGENSGFDFYGEPPARPKYLLALDYDTSVPIDGAARLVSYADAAANRPVIKNGRVIAGCGIIAPASTPKLSACVKSGFASVFGGYGGSGFSQYGVNGDFYMRVFGEGIFCGKGLIDLDAYYECCRALPENKILSHDILESGLLRCASVKEEFTEGFPADLSGYFKRLSRWQRGDIQNIPFIFSRFAPAALDRVKLSDNAIRALSPIFTLLCFFTGSPLIQLLAALAAVLPFFPLITRGNGGRFLSGVVPNRQRLVYRALSELILIPKSGLSALWAALISVIRMIRRRNLLCWTTAFEVSKSKNKALRTAGALVIASAVSLPVLFLSPVGFCLGILFLSAIPVFIALDAERPEKEFVLKEKYRAELKAIMTEEMQYYLDYADEENNMLPPDNVQFYPSEVVAYRTSPTNIGMYLLSLYCALRADIITRGDFCDRVSAALDSIESMRKYRGNLYNWYDTRTLVPLSDFVSSVDSGNFICCLTALKQGVKSDFPELYERINRLCDDTHIEVFYSPSAKLMAIGIDARTEKLTESRYDLLMSEARMTCYYGIARGQLPVELYHALSRTKGRCGVYRGSLSWSGTTFEYFMPQLLLPAPKGGLIYENLRYALHCQKKAAHKGLYGISESGFYAFDRQLNFQYRAFGVKETSLRPDYYFDPVYSPYSAFLMLPFDFYGSYNLLALYREKGCKSNTGGYYEALDLSKERTDGGRTVKSFMAHHKGMSIIALSNVLMDGMAIKLFMSDKDMKRGEEMNEERITAGDTLYKDRRPAVSPEEVNRRGGQTDCGCGFITGCDMSTALFSPEMAGEGALIKSIWRGRSLFYPPVYGQYDKKEPKQSFSVRISEGGDSYDLRGGSFSLKDGYNNKVRELTLSEKISLHPQTACQTHIYRVENTSSVERKLSLDIYIRPALGYDRAVTAHPAFSDLFLSVEYDEEQRIITVCRRHRGSTEKTSMAISFDSDMSVCFDREKVKLGEPVKENILSCVPAPCVYVSLPFVLKKGMSKRIKMNICCAAEPNDAKKSAIAMRNDAEEFAIAPDASPLSRVTAFNILPYLVYGGKNFSISEKPTGTFAELWKYGIDTSRSAVCFTCESDGDCLFTVLKAARRLINAGFELTLIILCTDKYERIKAAAMRSFEFDGRVTVIDSNNMSENDKALLKYFCCYYADVSDPVPRFSDTKKSLKRLPIKTGERIKPDEGFIPGGYVIDHTPAVPWSKALANPTFGALVHSNSLGFCWAKNSALNRLTPWDNELTGRENGIGLFISRGGKYTDIIKNSTCVFRPASARYTCRAEGVIYETTAAVPKKGMAQIIRLSAQNTSDKDISVSALFYAKLSGKAVTAVQDGCATARILSNDGFNGVFSLYSKGAVYGTDYDKAMCESFDVIPDGDCLAASVGIKLNAKQSRTVVFIISYASSRCRPNKLPEVLTALGREGMLHTDDISDKITYATGSETLDALMNVWLPDQIIHGRLYARTGFYQNGGAFGFRDQLQDAMAAAYIDPDILKKLILQSCRAQFEQGDVMHWYHITEEGISGVRTHCSDDMLWLPLALCHYIELTTDESIAAKPVQYSLAPELSGKEMYLKVGTGNAATVIEHCLNAAEYGYKRGPHGLLLFGGGDWNDSFNAVGENGKGESVWLSMFYCMVCDRLCELPKGLLSNADRDRYRQRAEQLRERINSCAYENGYYLRGFYDDGGKLGEQGAKHCEIDALCQAFAVLADINDKEHIDRSRSAINLAIAKLVDGDNGLIRLFYPPFSYQDKENKTGYVADYPEGVRENGGQYTHAAVWLAMAVNKLGYPDEAKRLLSMLNPALKDEAVYKNEPYYMSADVYAHPDCYGRGGWSLYTGAAGWYYRAVRNVCGGSPRTI